MADPPPAHHCKDCGLVFDSGKSLDVHLHYHKENLLSKWAQQQQAGEESNNNHVQQQKKNNRAPPVPTPDSSDNRYYQQNYLVAPQQPPPEDPGFILGTGTGFPLITRTPTPNSSSSPSPHHHNSNNFRYHPYQQYHPAPSPDHQQHRNGLVSSSSPQQCDKCGFICESTVQLMEHNAVAHNNHVLDQQHHNMFQIKAEPSQAEILDLDSHKVHVYQPPQRPQGNIEQDRSVSALMSWVNDNNKEQHRFHQQSGGLASPDCYGGAVSTTTLTPPEPDPITRHRGDNNSAYHPYEQQQQQQHLQQQQTNNQISSTQLPPAAPTPQQGSGGGGGGGKTKSSGNGGSWKSNEARRPKTYNCSACNKWFTSSGHLKRHYNTTLHKNAVKSSGVPDPASMPISVHHHPQKESSGGGFNQSQSSPPPEPTSPQPVEEPPPQPPPPPPPPLQPIPSSQHHLNHFNHFLPSPPNLMAGSSEVTGGLLLHTTPYTHHDLLLSQQQQQAAISSPPPGGLFPPPPPPFSPQGSLHTSPTFTSPPQPNPNFQPPHVSTIGQPVITSNNTSGSNLVDIYRQLLTTTDTDNARPLPSFSQQFVNHFVSLPAVVSSSNHVGGPYFDAVFDDNIFYTQQRPAIKIEEEEIREETTSPSTEFPTSTQQTSPTIFDTGMKFSTQTPPTIFNGEDTANATSRLKFPTQSSPTMFNAEQDVTHRLKYSPQMFSGGDATSRVKFDPAQSSPSTIFSGEEAPRGIIKSEEEIKSEASLYEMMMNDESIATENSEDNSQVSSTIESSPPVRHQEARKEEKLYRCEDCDKFFNKVCYLTQHNKSFHAGNKPYKCERCGKRFVAETERQVHVSKHAGEKPYKCEMCPKQFNHKTDLRRHMCLHTGDKPFTCEQCGKGFIRKDHMLKHCETHKRRRAAPNQSPHQAQVRKQLRMKLEQGGKLGVAAQPSAAPMAVMQLVM